MLVELRSTEEDEEEEDRSGPSPSSLARSSPLDCRRIMTKDTQRMHANKKQPRVRAEVMCSLFSIFLH